MTAEQLAELAYTEYTRIVQDFPHRKRTKRPAMWDNTLPSERLLMMTVAATVLERLTEQSLAITGLMLRSEGNDAVVEVEINGHWQPVVACDTRRAFSHIVEPYGIRMRLAEGKKCET